MNPAERRAITIQTFRKGYNCAQSVLSAYSADFKCDETQARAIASGFGAGIGLLQKTCGALTGAVMVLGIRFFDERNVAESKMRVYGKTRILMSRFEAFHGTGDCLPLLGVDISAETGLEKAREQRLFHLKCEKYLMDACDILDDLMSEK